MKFAIRKHWKLLSILSILLFVSINIVDYGIRLTGFSIQEILGLSGLIIGICVTGICLLIIFLILALSSDD